MCYILAREQWLAQQHLSEDAPDRPVTHTHIHTHARVLSQLSWSSCFYTRTQLLAWAGLCCAVLGTAGSACSQAGAGPIAGINGLVAARRRSTACGTERSWVGSLLGQCALCPVLVLSLPGTKAALLQTYSAVITAADMAA